VKSRTVVTLLATPPISIKTTAKATPQWGRSAEEQIEVAHREGV